MSHFWSLWSQAVVAWIQTLSSESWCRLKWSSLDSTTGFGLQHSYSRKRGKLAGRSEMIHSASLKHNWSSCFRGWPSQSLSRLTSFSICRLETEVQRWKKCEKGWKRPHESARLSISSQPKALLAVPGPWKNWYIWKQLKLSKVGPLVTISVVIGCHWQRYGWERSTSQLKTHGARYVPGRQWKSGSDEAFGCWQISRKHPGNTKYNYIIISLCAICMYCMGLSDNMYLMGLSDKLLFFMMQPC